MSMSTRLREFSEQESRIYAGGCNHRIAGKAQTVWSEHLKVLITQWKSKAQRRFTFDFR